MAGSSTYFGEGFVTYSNGSKERLLGVPTRRSSSTAPFRNPSQGDGRGSAKGLRRRLRALCDGGGRPDGGRRRKPVGLVFVGISDANGTVAEKVDLTAWSRSRDAIRERSANRAFDLLRHRLLDGNE